MAASNNLNLKQLPKGMTHNKVKEKKRRKKIDQKRFFIVLVHWRFTVYSADTQTWEGAVA
jgi:hypothetical protein